MCTNIFFTRSLSSDLIILSFCSKKLVNLCGCGTDITRLQMQKKSVLCVSERHVTSIMCYVVPVIL